MVRLTDRPDMTLDVYRGRKTTIQYNANCGTEPTSNKMKESFVYFDVLWLNVVIGM